ncbi:MAG: polysaccharide deacetylase family protein [Ignavibacteriaceae bacterium]
MKIYFTLLIALLTIFPISGQNLSGKTPWNNKQCAVSLTYDDAMDVHLDNVVPILDSLGIKATFYITCNFTGFRNRTDEWKQLSVNGHELGNHTLFHPCEGRSQGRVRVYDLNDYTVQRFKDEVVMTNLVLNLLDGKTRRTFAYPCGHLLAGDSSYVESIKNEFVAARTVHAVMQKIDEIDLYSIGCFMVINQTGEELIELVKKAEETNSYITFIFHGVGNNPDYVPLEVHNKLVDYLKQNEDKIWVAPLIDVADYIEKRDNN